MADQDGPEYAIFSAVIFNWLSSVSNDVLVCGHPQKSPTIPGRASRHPWRYLQRPFV